jgi:uncharacterized RDD family membrane protein YckC
MNDSEPSPSGQSDAFRPHAYDPYLNPELFEGVLARRLVAFFIDVFIIAVPVALFSMFVLFLGVVTFGFGWLLFFLLSPASVIWALLYYGLTLGSSYSATIGMRIVEIEMRTWYGAPAYFVLGAVHAVVYWITISILTPFVLLIGLLNDRHRLLHDMMVGVVLINAETRAQVLRRTPQDPHAPI